jgi:nitrogen fixation-related uncharacterized protein
MLKALPIAFLLLICCSLSLRAQKNKRNKDLVEKPLIAGDTVEIIKPQKHYDPKIASRRSAILPGLGQIYNDSWWKVPILYAGFATNIYFIGYNNEQYEDAKGTVEELLIIEEETGLSPTQENELRSARRQTDYWRNNRDLLYITLLGIYGLNVLEATIDAHMKGFDVSDNLALNLKPKVGVISNGAPYIGVGLTFKIGR